MGSAKDEAKTEKAPHKNPPRLSFFLCAAFFFQSLLVFCANSNAKPIKVQSIKSGEQAEKEAKCKNVFFFFFAFCLWAPRDEK